MRTRASNTTATSADDGADRTAPGPLAGRVRGYRQRADAALDRWLPAATIEPQRLHAAIRYAAMGQGKRLRPLLAYGTGEWLGLPAERLDGIAATLELVHAYALVHADLPALRNERARRGRPTTHVAYDEATAILVGDALQAHAYYVLATDAALQTPPPVRRQLIRDLAGASGSDGMAGGQALELAATGPGQVAAAFEGIFGRKTGRLIEAAVVMPSRLAEAALGPAAVAAAAQFGRCFGLAYQVADDLAHGTGHLLAALGPDAMRERLDALRGEAIAALAGVGGQAELLAWLCHNALAGDASHWAISA